MFAEANIYFVYEPLSLLFKSIQHQALGLDPAKIFLVNSVLHAVVSVLTFKLALQLYPSSSGEKSDKSDINSTKSANKSATKSFSAASSSTLHRLYVFLGTATFATHPLRAEVVSWLSCQPYLLASILSLLSLMRYVHNNNNLDPLSILLYLAAVLCKTITVPLCAIFVIHDVFMSRNILKESALSCAKNWPVLLISAAMAAKQLRADTVHSSTMDLTFTETINAKLTSLAFYAMKTVDTSNITGFFPLLQHTHTTLLSFPVLLATTFLLLTTVSLAKHIRSPTLATSIYAAFSGVYLCLLSPTLVTQHGWPMVGASRYSYLLTAILLPSFFGLVCRAIEKSTATATAKSKGPPLLRTLLHAAAIGLSVVIISKNSAHTTELCNTWGTNVAMWNHTSTTYADSAAPIIEVFQGNLARGLLRRGGDGDVVAAHEALRSGYSRRGAPNQIAGIALSTIYYDIGVMFKNEGEMSYAVEAYQISIEHYPAFTMSLNNLGNCFSEMGKFDTAVQYLEAAEAIESSAQTLFNLGNVYFKAGLNKKAAEKYERAMALAPKERRPMIQKMINIAEQK
jgi:hypothetical protein